MTRKTKVLHVIKMLSLGGAETNLLNLVQAFDATAIENHVAYSFGGEIEPRFRAANLSLFKYADRAHRVKDPQSLGIVWRLAKYIREQKIDIVHTHNFNAHIWGLLAAKLAGARVVEHVHDFRYTPEDDLRRRHGYMTHYRFMRWFKKRSDRVIVLTHANADYVVDNGFADAARVREIQNGIPLDTPQIEKTDWRAQLGLDGSAFLVLTSARMDPTKNIEMVLKTAKRTTTSIPHAVFVIAGSGSHLQRYQALARELGVEGRVRFVGFQQDIFGLLATADVFLLASFLELHSIAILEAQKMGVPIVVSANVGCNDEFIEDGRNGILCDPFEAAPWARALERLAADDAARRAMGHAGHKTCVERFALPLSATRIARVYEELMR